MTQAATRQRDSELCAQLARSVDGAFEALVLAYQDRLYRFALRFCADSQDAEEITQDALLRAHSALLRYERERIRALSLQAWLYRITLNVARNRARKKAVPQLSLAAAAELPAWEAAQAPLTGPEAYAERQEQSADLARLLATLPARYRSVLLLRFVEDMSYQDVAAVLHKPLGTIKSDVHRGLTLLRQALQAGETPTEQRHTEGKR